MKVTKFSSCARLVVEVERGLERGWSPQQISARLKLEFPDEPVMRISHETIYLSLYVQSRGELWRQLTANLRTGRSARKPHGRLEKRGRIVDMVNISQRPPDVEDRAVPGHWEGDLIVGAQNRSAVATLVERQTRFVMLAYLGTDRSTGQVIEALQGQITGLPEHLKLSLTWDQGHELAAHQRFTVDTGVQVFFCDPRSPWQRGSNENTNGLLRQYLPKGHRPRGPRPARAGPDRRVAQRPPTPDSRVDEPGREDGRTTHRPPVRACLAGLLVVWG